MQYTPLIITLVLLLIIILLIFFLVRYLQQKTRQVSQALFGTSDITKAATQLKQEASTTPKSVSAMTSLLLPKIVSDFPEFNYNEMKERANNVVTGYLQAVTSNNPALLQEGSDQLRLQLEQQLQMLSNENSREHFDQIHIHRTEISQYRNAEGRCIITFQTALECYHYITSDTGALRKGSKEYKYQTKYNTDLVYIQKQDVAASTGETAVSVTCPNCGAPIEALGSKVCAYCGSPVVELNIHAWAFHNIEEVS